jgi:uncharacterized protein
MIAVRKSALIALASLSCLTLPRLGAAQQPPQAERATFVMLAGGDTISVETMTRTPSRLEGDLMERSRGLRFRYVSTLTPDAGISSTETWLYRGTDTVALQHATLRLERDTIVVEMSGGAPTQRLKTTPGAVLYINPSTALLEQAVLHARAVAAGATTAEVPIFVSAGGANTTLGVKWLGSDSAVLSLGNTEMRASVGPGGRLTGVAMPSQNVRVVRIEGTRSVSMPKPDYSGPAGAPYKAEEVIIRTPSGVTLAGTLTIPTSRPASGAPAVVTITGSGPQDRDESLPGITGYRLFRQIADTLGRRGIAVFRLDDRGVGGSEMGPPGPTSADFADDVRAALAYLRTRSDIDGNRLGLVGHSEGGMIAPMVGATDTRLRAIVLMAGPARSGRTIITYQQRYAADSMQHLTGATRDSMLRVMAKQLDSTAAAQPWVKFFLDYDPLVTARKVKQPVLVLQGETDRQVTSDQAAELAAALRSSGNSDVTVKVFPQTNHLFLADPDGNPLGYAKLPSKSVRPEVLGTVADWLGAKLK